MMVLMAAIGGFGLSGVGYQLIALGATGHLAPRLDATIFAVLCAVFSIRGLGMLFRRLQLVSTTALEPQEFLGNVATVTSLEARQGYAASAKFTDRHGYVQPRRGLRRGRPGGAVRAGLGLALPSAQGLTDRRRFPSPTRRDHSWTHFSARQAPYSPRRV